MNKELEEALKILKDVSTAMNYPNKYLGYSSAKMAFDEDIAVIEQALTELKQIKEANPSEAMEELEKYLFNEWKQNHVNVGCDYKLEANLDKQLNNLKAIKNALLEFKRLDLLLKLPSEQSSSHFTYKDKNLVCMQSTKYSKLMNAFLEYEEIKEIENKK